MTSASGPAAGPARAIDGWVEAMLFAFALSLLNVSYGLGNQLGMKPVTMLVWAMPSAAVMLLVVGGLGRDWAQVMAHPLSLVVGGGIIAMEAVYYILLLYLTPTDGSLLVRLGVPVSMLLGYLLRGRLPTGLAVVGGAIIVATVAIYVPHMASEAPLTGLGLAIGCAVIMSSRAFATEFHPWNRQARTIPEKMRVTGLVLLVASLAGLVVVGAAMWAAESGAMARPAWLPTPAELVDPPSIALGLGIGVVVLTVMQYLGFSVVVKIGTESFIATTALIPLMTLGVQTAAVALGILRPIPIDWTVAPAMIGMMTGVALVIAGQHRRSP